MPPSSSISSSFEGAAVRIEVLGVFSGGVGVSSCEHPVSRGRDIRHRHRKALPTRCNALVSRAGVAPLLFIPFSSFEQIGGVKY